MGTKTRRNQKRYGELVLLNNDKQAMIEGPCKKSWTKHDIRPIAPLTNNQQAMFRSYFDNNQVCAYGSAGTGKTYLAMYLALCDILDGNHDQNHLIIVRSTVATREIGFVPGTLEEKIAVHETPYRDILADLFRRQSTYDDMKAAGIIKFMPTSFVRGLTWDNSVIVIDEGQNMNWHEINSIMTRVGSNTRIIFTGDLAQTDLNKSGNDKSGMERFIKTASGMTEFAMIRFTVDDIIRSDFVKSWIRASEQSS